MVLTERIDVRWGDVSVVRAEYALFDAAYRHGGISFIIIYCRELICPLSHKIISIVFFEDNDGKEFIGYYQGDITTEINRSPEMASVPGSLRRQAA